MNPILDQDFALPADGLYHIAPEGEFIHKKTGLRQVLDADACAALAADFTARAAAPDFAGVLVDYDHESLDMDKRTEAAGWLMTLEHRPGSGLWGRIRWTDSGEAAVKGGRYRFLSPVWNQEDCENLGEMRVRPKKLLNCAITNQPQLHGAAPLSNAIPVSLGAAVLIANRALANALTPGNDRQRRAVFAKLRGAPLAAQPKTSDQLDAEEKAKTEAEAKDRAQRLQLAAIIARRKAIEADQAKAKPWGDAESARRAIGVGVPKAAKAKKAAPAAATAAASGGSRSSAKKTSQIKTVAQLPRAYVRPTTDRLPGGVGLQWRGQIAQTAAGRTAAANVLQPGETLVDYLGRRYANREPMSDDQRRAMFARLRGSGGTGRSWDAPSVVDRAWAAQAKTFPHADELLRGLAGAGGGASSAKALASGLKGAAAKTAAVAANVLKTIGGTITKRAEGVTVPAKYAADAEQADAYLRGVYVGQKQAAGFDWSSVPAKIKDALAQGYREADDLASSVLVTDPAEIARLNAKHGVNVRPPLQSLLHNRGGAMTDEQRRAMFARMDNYRGRAAPSSTQDAGNASPAAASAAGPSLSPDPAAPPAVSHAPTRESNARLDQLYGQRAALEAAAPKPPEPPPSMQRVDVNAVRAETMRAGKDAGAVLAAVADAENTNRAIATELDNIERKLRASGVPAAKLDAAVQKELDRRQAEYAKQVDDYEKAKVKNLAAIAAIDKKIGDEEIRATEEQNRAAQLAANDRAREALAADKAQKALALAKEKKAADDAAKAKAAQEKAAAAAAKASSSADPVRENAKIKRMNRAYAEAVLRGDTALADTIAPGADHAKNAATLADMLPDPTDIASPRNSKAMAGLLSTVERVAPRDYSKL